MAVGEPDANRVVADEFGVEGRERPGVLGHLRGQNGQRVAGHLRAKFACLRGRRHLAQVGHRVVRSAPVGPLNGQAAILLEIEMNGLVFDAVILRSNAILLRGDVPIATLLPMTNDQPSIHAADRLLNAIESKRTPVCVGIDPVIEKMPDAILEAAKNEGDTDLDAPTRAAICFGTFCSGLLEAVAPHVPCVKFQSACFERYGHSLVFVLRVLIAQARSLGMQVILDAKRGDIGLTAEHYAAGVFDAESSDFDPSADWLTINSYLGEDGITPFLRPGHGAFALVRTSNPGGDAIQNLVLQDGRTVAHAVAEIVARIGSTHVGQRGYSSLGAVVGATKREDARALRQIMPQQVFLVPGYGAQGGGIDDVLPCFKSDGTGAIVTASRSVIYAFKPDDPNWAQSVGDAAAKFADEIGRAAGMR